MSLVKDDRKFRERRGHRNGGPDSRTAALQTTDSSFRTPTLTSTLIFFFAIELAFVVTSIFLGISRSTSNHVFNTSLEGIDYRIYAIIVVAFVVISVAIDSFRHLQSNSLSLFVRDGLLTIAAALLILTFALFLSDNLEAYPRNLLLWTFIYAVLATTISRIILYFVFSAAAAKGIVRGRRVVFIGRRKTFDQHIAHLKSLRGAAQIVCCPIPPPNFAFAKCQTAESLASALITECRSLQADDVVLLADEARQDELKHISSTFLEMPAAVYALPTRHLRMWVDASLLEVSGLPALGIYMPRMSETNRLLKRAIDIVFASIALVALLPLMIVTSIAVSLDSKGPIFFSQIRHGYNNQKIRILKYRTMRVSSDTTFRQATRHDDRITRVGRILRLSGIDELPQLLNVLRGDMSIVGPRPHAVPHNEMFGSQIARFSRRHNVLPGITGWAQVNGYRGETDTLQKMIQRIECDLYYVDNWSLWLDLKIIALTLISKKTYLNAG